MHDTAASMLVIRDCHACTRNFVQKTLEYAIECVLYRLKQNIDPAANEEATSDDSLVCGQFPYRVDSLLRSSALMGASCVPNLMGQRPWDQKWIISKVYFFTHLQQLSIFWPDESGQTNFLFGKIFSRLFISFFIRQVLIGNFFKRLTTWSFRPYLYNLMLDLLCVISCTCKDFVQHS